MKIKFIILGLIIFNLALNLIGKEAIYDYELSDKIKGKVKEYSVYFIKYNNAPKLKIDSEELVYSKRYNQKKELIEESSEIGENLRKIKYTYDNFSNITTLIIYKNNNIVSNNYYEYSYDDNGNVFDKHEYNKDNKLLSVCFYYNYDKNETRTCITRNPDGEIVNTTINSFINTNNGFNYNKSISIDGKGEIIYKENSKYDKNGNIVSSDIYNRSNKKEISYKYKIVYKNNKILKKVEYKNSKISIITGFEYNSKDEIVIERITKYIPRKIRSIRRYIYDKNGNWIYLLNDNGSGYYREITYYD